MTSAIKIKSQQTPVYREKIDGLRALAVLPVILFHAEVGGI